jgi:hypothetical protein
LLPKPEKVASKREPQASLNECVCKILTKNLDIILKYDWKEIYPKKCHVSVIERIYWTGRVSQMGSAGLPSSTAQTAKKKKN